MSIMCVCVCIQCLLVHQGCATCCCSGDAFSYKEACSAKSLFQAVAVTSLLGLVGAAFVIPPLRYFSKKLVPKPGEGTQLFNQILVFYALPCSPQAASCSKLVQQSPAHAELLLSNYALRDCLQIEQNAWSHHVFSSGMKALRLVMHMQQTRFWHEHEVLLSEIMGHRNPTWLDACRAKQKGAGVR